MNWLESIFYILGRCLGLLLRPLKLLSNIIDYVDELTASISLMDVYSLGVVIVGVIVFIGAWIYCIFTYGFLLGVGLGWLPAMITGGLAGIFWPILAIGIAVLYFMGSH